jgi:hypothetical protein
MVRITIAISLWETFLPDHHVVYRRLGIDQLISFGNNSDDVKRQEPNRPTDTMKCETMDSKELSGDLSEMRGDRSVVLWLDYMFPEQRREQLQEVETILQQLKPGDLLRVTINAEYQTFGGYEPENDLFDSLEATAAAKLHEQLGEYLPAKLTSLSAAEFPKVLAGAVQLAAERSRKHSRNVKIVPILSTSYADGHRMVTAACVIREPMRPNFRHPLVTGSTDQAIGKTSK